MACEG
jgi:hypothetical protein